MSKKSESRKHSNPVEQRHRIDLARMESDLAYFQARLEIIGEPKTTNESAQHKLFQMLCRTLGKRIVHVKRELSKKDSKPPS